MAAPTLQAESAAFTIVTTGACAPTIPSHLADDILLATVMVWVPVTAGTIYDIPTPANWNKLGSVDLNGATKDGQIAWFWRRAAGAGETVSFARGTIAPGTTAWDTGTDGAYGARVDVIRGCDPTGNPYDDFLASAQFTTANQNTPAVTVSGADRLVMFFEAHCVDSAAAQFTARTGFTMGTHRGATTGTGGGAQNARLATGSSESATATTHAAPAAGRFYAFGGISFKPIPPPTDTAVARVELATPNEPDFRSAHKLWVRARKTAGGATTLKAILYEGATDRSGTLTTAALTTSLADYSLSIATADAEDITDYSDLEVEWWGDSTAGSTSDVEVAEIWLELPDGTGGAGDTAPQGGAIAAGSGPVAKADVATGGAVGAGSGPVSRATLTAGGGLAGGTDPTALTTAVPGPGGAIGAGASPAPRAAVDQGGAIAQGVTLPGVTATPTPGGAVAGGTDPTALTTAVPGPGGGSAAGNGPQTTAAAASGGATATGSAPAASASVAAGGGSGAGTAPAPSTAVAQGGADATGTTAAAVVSVGAGGALAGGVAPSESGVVSETPVPGGATAAGQGPSATTTSAAGACTAGGSSPSTSIALTPGGALASGNAVTASASVSSGGATAAGASPTAQVNVTIGGGDAGGTGAAARVEVALGGAIAGGTAPSEGGLTSETPVPGGALAGGTGPNARTTGTIGGGNCTGAAPAPCVALVSGGALAAGTGPTANTTATPAPGGALAAGTGPSSRVSVSVGGAPGGGISPPGARVVFTAGGAIAGGNAPGQVGLATPTWDGPALTFTLRASGYGIALVASSYDAVCEGSAWSVDVEDDDWDVELAASGFELGR